MLLLNVRLLETAWSQDIYTNTLYPPRTYLVFFFYLGAIHHLFIYLSDLRTTYSVACKVEMECSLRFVQYAHVTQFASHSTATVVAAASATTHNRV